jgi:hypothetical protein
LAFSSSGELQFLNNPALIVGYLRAKIMQLLQSPKPTPDRLLTLIVSTEERLQELWQIDENAYQENSLDFERFRAWWEQYALGLKIITNSTDRIVGASGVWALNEAQTRYFISGQVKEHELQPLSHEQLDDAPSNFWYCSGIVTIPEMRGTAFPFRKLIRATISTWLATGHVSFPVNVYALGYSPEGITLLKKLGFEEIKASEEMPDRCPLYWRLIKSPSEATQFLFG